ncbi:MAG TPA: glutaredoxin family protein [Microbacterium sp.]|jgi:glutaredoxin|uniref:glutaredoxin family protein n=1 Tax=Microbacterium sp. TaxID=51671 RepID=UPI002F91C1D7
MSAEGTITVYGTKWCSDCTRARQQLTRAGVPFTDIDIEDDSAAAGVAAAISGSRRIPVVVLPNGEVLVEPSHHELADALAV